MNYKKEIRRMRWLAATIMLVAAMVMPTMAWAEDTFNDGTLEYQIIEGSDNCVKVAGSSSCASNRSNSTEPYTVTVAVGGLVEGSVIVKIGGEEKETVSKGISKGFDVNGDIVISPAEGVAIASTTVEKSDGQEIAWETRGDDRVILYNNITSDIIARFTLEKKMLITVSPSSVGKIYVDDKDVTGTSFYVKTGTKLNVRAEANSGYRLSCLKINDEINEESTVDNYTVNGDIAITAEFALDWFVVGSIKYQVINMGSVGNTVRVIGVTPDEQGVVIIPESVSYDEDGEGSEYDAVTYTITEIGKDAFANDSEITSVEIPASIEAIGAMAFSGCTSLKTFKIRKASAGTPSPGATRAAARATADDVVVPVVEANAFDDIVGIATLYVPEGWKEAFKADAVWSRFTKIKEYRDDVNETVLAELTLTASEGGTFSVGTEIYDKGTHTVKVAEGSSLTVDVIPDEGYILSSLLYGGLSMTVQSVYGCHLTIGNLEGENSLEAVFSLSTGIGSAREVAKNVYVRGGRIVVDGAAAGEVVIVCDAAGRVLRREVSVGEPIEIAIAAGKVYIVRIGKRVIKLTM